MSARRGTIGHVFWFFVALIAAILVTITLVAVGRGDSLGPAYPDRHFLELPSDRALTASDLDELRLGVALRGYRMDEVDDLLDRLAREIAERDAYVEALKRQLAAPAPLAADAAKKEAE